MGGPARSRALAAQVLLALAIATALPGCDEEPPAEPDDGPPSIATLVMVQGTVEVQRDGHTSSGAPGQPLRSGDVLSTGAASSALVRSSGGEEVEVSEHARLRLVATQAQLTVELQEGRLVTRGGDAGARRLAVRAPGTDTLLEMGDVIDITARGGGSRLTVTEGEIILLGGDGGSVSVGKGQSAELEMGEIRLAERPPPPRPVIQPIPIQLSPQRGKTLLRPKGQRRFTPAGAGEVALADGTAFQVARVGARCSRPRAG